MKKFIAILLCTLTVVSLAACELTDILNGNDKDNDKVTDLLVVYKNQVSKEEFQAQYKYAYENNQPDYTKDFVYTYSHEDQEIDSQGNRDESATYNTMQYDADAEIIHIRNQFQNNDPDAPVTEDYYWTYELSGDNVLFYSSKTNTTETRALGFDAFWEFAHSQIPMVLFPNPYKLYDDATYYVDLKEDGEKVFTLYSEDEDGYSLRQIMISDTEMIYFTKKYDKEDDYESMVTDRYTVSSRSVTIEK